MKSISNTPVSLLDLVTYAEGSSAAGAIRNSRRLAQWAEAWGYRRYWVAEHHNLDGIASSATVILMGYLAEATESIRIGSGGIMLPNHAPFIVAEQVGTLESIYPGRIDLGLGRAPGTDPLTMRALRRHSTGANFDENVAELMAYLAPEQPGQAVKAIPGAGLDVPIWILGSSTYSAHLAAAIGRPYAFASHFAPGELMASLEIYRREFRPSPALSAPYVMVGVPAFGADTDEQAEHLATSMYLRSLGIMRGKRMALQPPVRDMDAAWSQAEALAVADRMALMVVGGEERLREGFQQILDATRADELIVVSDAYDFEDRLRSFDAIARAAGLPRRID
ncbi:MAG TPA: LLM class flavin-dependent oxidoreductase [Usitatibacter sp.]|jgi:luciferase family oxidoreductase group 1|nr:LLM class flavin-dependent oxidoreductase [Usitatibacter sp.]